MKTVLLVATLLLMSGQAFAAKSTGSTPANVPYVPGPGHTGDYPTANHKDGKIFKRLMFWIRKQR